MNVFVAGGTGEAGRLLIPMLIGRGHSVRALARHQAELAAETEAVFANPVDAASFSRLITPCDTFLFLVERYGRKTQYHSVELASIRASVLAAVDANVGHFVYAAFSGSPDSLPYSYVRREGERIVREGGLPATILRLGALIDDRLPSSASSASGGSTFGRPDRRVLRMMNSVVAAVEVPSSCIRVVTRGHIPSATELSLRGTR